MEFPAMDLANKVAIVTGGARGLGRVEALALAKAGADISLADIDLPTCEKTAKEIAMETGRRALALYADVSIASDVQKMVDKTVAEFEKIDILVNNAALLNRKKVLELSVGEWDELMAVNLRGPFLCSQAVARQMIRQGKGGRIINITSFGAFLGQPGRSAYCASKGGLAQLTRVLAIELAPYGINVNSIAPGIFASGVTEETSRVEQVFWKHLRERTLLKRPGQPEELGGVVVFLASAAASYTTGQTFIVDGGFSAH